VEVAGATVGAALESLLEQFPGLREQVFTEDGSLNRFVNVYVNGRDVRYEQELETPVGESDEVILLPAMAGGR
jgi:MoaD family protein